MPGQRANGRLRFGGATLVGNVQPHLGGGLERRASGEKQQAGYVGDDGRDDRLQPLGGGGQDVGGHGDEHYARLVFRVDVMIMLMPMLCVCVCARSFPDLHDRS